MMWLQVNVSIQLDDIYSHQMRSQNILNKRILSIKESQTNTNIEKTFFTKKDFVEPLKVSAIGQDSKANIKKDKKENESSSSDDSSEESEPDEINGKPIIDSNGEKLINFKSPNLMNSMLPYAQIKQKEEEEKKQLLGKRQAEEELQTLENGQGKVSKRQANNQGYAQFMKDQKQQQVLSDLAEKYILHSKYTFKDLGGIDPVIKQLREMLEWPLKYRNIFTHLGVKPPRGILISGPAGTGKTQLALAISGEYPDIPFYKLNGPEIVSRLSGQSEENIRNIFEAVKKNLPAIMFIDELDSIAGKREDAVKDMEVRIVAQIAACLDEIENQGIDLIVIGATSRPETIDQGLRRAGRFEKEISLGVPNEESRMEIIKILTKNMRLKPEIDYQDIVRLTPGYVGADISTLCKEASILAVERIINTEKVKPADEEMDEDDSDENLDDIYIQVEDFKIASKRVQPSAQREGFTTVPNTTWNDVGALFKVRQELQMTIVEPILNPQKFKRVGLSAPAGVLLYGPPGCGKTLVAKAVSNESKANFISIKGPELLNKYVGESEKAVRQLFKRARASAPCVIFFDELDSLCPKRGSENNTSSERVVNQLLTEMDGLDERRDVFVIAATNRPDIIDPAMLRPGRLDKLLYVPLPTKEDRHQILQTITRSLPIQDDVELTQIAYSQECSGYSGADLSALVREAQLNALKNNLDDQFSTDQIFITQRDFIVALQKVFPSVSREDEVAYQQLERSLKKTRAHITHEQQ
ncbi:ribosome biogenesis atpase rix7 [Stylonychia lemnae]|uniref:Ribosome biogenesis atpase rix7 n=1 Tax=Stylonychia lemnae TaxID=5949 RepID=A0A078AZK3_STYLE|nr:ribosome biogenesis atpase rix7 [Stylonychia lemnae]|eukprot:CDW86238.1 ribosome biogenesis atpase rix7 [Stylonychia lemnae]